MRPLYRFLFPMLLAPALIASAASADDATARRSITITANGSVTAVPDLARITSGVATEAPVARDAVAKNSEAMRKIIAGLKASGIDPARRRTGPAWSQFLRSQAEAILACDFFTVDLPGGAQAYVLAVIEHATRRIRVLGVTLHPTRQWRPSRPATSSWT